MSIYILDFGTMVATILALIFVTLVLRAWRRRQVDLGLYLIDRDDDKVYRLRESDWETGGGTRSQGFLESRLYTISERQARNRAAIKRAERLAFRVNVITSLIAFVPIVFAIVNLIQNHPQQALNFNLASFALLVATKGGLFLFAVLQKVPVMLGAKIVSDKLYGRFGPKKKRPTTPEQRHE